jgi:Holliday junction DNA helicase RuvA
MIGSLRGTVISKGLQAIILEVGGVGYHVLVPTKVVDSVQAEQELLVHTHLAVREDALTLYGFTTESEKDLFELLVGISGIGPKIALAILSTYSPAEVQSAVANGQAEAFSAVSGIGKKNAERIVLELKNKVWTAELQPVANVSSDLHQALAGLGYSQMEIMKLKNIDQAVSLSEQVKIALKQIG